MNIFKYIFVVTFLILNNHSFAGFTQFTQKSFKYQTNYGFCPEKSSTDLVVKIMSAFENNRSLKEVKDLFIQEKWEEKYFLSRYRVDYVPPKRLIKIFLECPKPLARAVVYQADGREHYSATLVEGGKLLDPSFETLLKNEKILKVDLPSLVLTLELINQEKHHSIAEFLAKFDDSLLNRVSEVILSKEGALTLILSSKYRPTNVFMGSDLWDEKLVRLNKILQHLGHQNKNASQVNLTSLKKIVVKF